MRYSIFLGLILFYVDTSAFAQQNSNAVAPAVSAPSTQESGPFVQAKPSASLKKLSKQACASICTKSVMELLLTDEDKNQFNQCADALLCLNSTTAPPLASQPRHFDFPFLIRDYLTRTPDPWQPS
jgi:hypothetical protein